MSWNYIRESQLLRLAPWADIPSIREALITACEKVFEDWGDRAPDEYREQFDNYISGDRPTIPRVHEFQRALVRIMRGQYYQHEGDLRWGNARTEIDTYFFRRSYWNRE